MISEIEFKQSLSQLMHFDFQEKSGTLLGVWMPGGDRNNMIVVAFSPAVKGPPYELTIVSRGEKTLQKYSYEWSEVLQIIKSHNL